MRVTNRELEQVYKDVGLAAARAHFYRARMRDDPVPSDLLEEYEAIVLELRALTARLERVTGLIVKARSGEDTG